MTSARLLALLTLLLTAPWARAHTLQDTLLDLREQGRALTGHWEITRQDLAFALRAQADAAGTAAPAGGAQAEADYSYARLAVHVGGRDCALARDGQRVEPRANGAVVVLDFAVSCPVDGTKTVTYGLFFDVHPEHRGLLRFETAGGVRSAVLTPERPTLELAPRSPWRAFAEYWEEGVWHIWAGFDHLLFLVSLLLPAVLWREGGCWVVRAAFRPALLDVVGIVTAFTLAHSLTLSLAALEWVSLPGPWVESAIAATVMVAALNNLYPLVPARRWVMAFVFGLIHGFGFAGALGELGLPAEAFAVSLLGFNLGVETGQLAIVTGFLPLAYLARGTWAYRRVALQGGSVAVAVLALGWLLDRSLGLALLPAALGG